MPRSKRLVWQILPYHLIIVLLSFLAVTLYASGSFRKYYLESSRTDLFWKAEMLRRTISDRVPGLDPAGVDVICKEAGRAVPTRFTVILPSGDVIGDSMADPALMGNHGDRPEIRQALSGKSGVTTHLSFTLREPFLYAAVPYFHDGRIAAVVRTSIPETFLTRTLGSFYLQITLGGLVLMFLALFFSVMLSLRINRAFGEVQRGAARFSTGDLGYRMHVESFAEIESLAETMNGMADQIDRRIRTITSQRNELEAVLSGMAEAVIAVDSEERVINCNHAAESLFGISLGAARDRTIQETIRNSHLQLFIKRVLEGRAPLSEDTVIHFPPERYLQASGSLLLDSDDHAIGAIIVLNDITRLKNLENIRRDFVANVSHELKTPITSIKGFVETLRDGAADDPATARRFLDIILRHTDRLNAIIGDLLSLSRLEQETESERIPVETVRAADLLRDVLLVCDRKARDKDITITADGPEDISLRGNPALLEQAVVNLVDNAIKYSDPGSTVLLNIGRTEREVSVRVTDHGIGIPEKHLPRIFERFYRVDRARSREMGGTGLGLAIVKHIVQAHEGRITVSSAPGKGSTFTLHLPSGA